MTLQIPIQDEDRTIPADAPTKTARPVPDLAEFLHKLDKDYASMPKRTKATSQPTQFANHPENDLPNGVKVAALFLILIATSAMGLVLSILVLLLGGTWATVLVAHFSPPLIATTAWCIWIGK